jgi:predicted ABC-type ATPase
MPKKRMRVFAGPNGSGKSTSLNGILTEKGINLGVYVNADEIEKELNQIGCLNISKFKIYPTEIELLVFFKASTFSPKMRNEPNLWQKLTLEGDFLKVKSSIDSYLAADIAEFIRQKLVKEGISFTYETVMSHPDKIEFMKEAQNKGYKVYLYFVSTTDPEINSYRVKLRVTQNGHSVPIDKIKDRYYKSLSNLKAAVQSSNNAYIFDNSRENAYLVATVLNGNEVYPEELAIPKWVETYLLS